MPGEIRVVAGLEAGHAVQELEVAYHHGVASPSRQDCKAGFQSRRARETDNRLKARGKRR